MGQLNIRGVPDETMKLLKVRSAEAGVTLREYVLGVLWENPLTPTGIVVDGRPLEPGETIKEAVDKVGEARSSDGTGGETPVTASKRAKSRQRTSRARSASPVPHQQFERPKLTACEHGFPKGLCKKGC